MGEIFGAAIVSHVPPIVAPIDVRRQLNGGTDFTLNAGLERLRRECLDRLRPDTIVVFDTHWYSTVEHIVSAHERRAGRYTSEELPRTMSQIPYDLPGDPELAHALATLGRDRTDTRILACDDPVLPIHYPTVNIAHLIQGDERWVSIGVCQTAEPEDWLLLGELLAQAIAALDRRVVLLASGGLSHRFWPMREFADHETADLANIRTPEARAADEQVIAWFETGDHRSVIDFWPEYRAHAPEGRFAHYLMMAGALGGRRCTAPGELFSAYESSAGTGQAHIWFERPTRGWTN